MSNWTIASEKQAIDSASKAIRSTDTFKKISKNISAKIEQKIPFDKDTLQYIAPAVVMGIQGKISTTKIKKINLQVDEISFRPDITYNIRNQEVSFSLKMEVAID
jgi:flavin-binding protein dodecin